jgi:hypothetical protein
MVAANLDIASVAEASRVDVRTAERWLAGRVPHSRYRWAVASLVRQDEVYLWPDAFSSTPARSAGTLELVLLYAHRSEVLPEVWWNLFCAAEHEICLLVYAALFLPEQHLSLIDLLAEKAAAGCAVRILLGDASSPRIVERGQEEQFGEGIVSRAKVALMHYEPLADRPNVNIRVHGTTLYNSIYRFDNTMLVNAHVYGCNAFTAPVLHLRRLTKGGLFDTYEQSFEAVWAVSRPAFIPHNGVE